MATAVLRGPIAVSSTAPIARGLGGQKFALARPTPAFGRRSAGVVTMSMSGNKGPARGQNGSRPGRMGLGFLGSKGFPKFRPQASEASAETSMGGGGGSGGAGGGGGGGGDGDGDEDDDSPATTSDCEKYGVKSDSLPADFAEALANGEVTHSILSRYASLMSNPLAAILMGSTGFRNRLLADPGFLVKIGIELGIGIFTKAAAEYEKRKGNFSKELDFVMASVIMALIADFVLVWLPAPSMAFGAKGVVKEVSKFAKYMESCPKNAFQKVPSGGKAYSLGQRIIPVLRNGTKLFGVGFFASNVGVGVTNTLIWVRKQLDPTWEQLNPPQNQLKVSLAYASYMASSSNLRYQLVAGIIEERIVEVLLTNPAYRGAASTVIRTLNTFLGSLMWVDYIRLLGLQKKA